MPWEDGNLSQTVGKLGLGAAMVHRLVRVSRPGRLCIEAASEFTVSQLFNLRIRQGPHGPLMVTSMQCALAIPQERAVPRAAIFNRNRREFENSRRSHVIRAHDDIAK